MEAEGLNDILVEAMKRYGVLQKYIQSPIMMIKNKIEKNMRNYYEEMRLIYFLTNGFFIIIFIIAWKFGWKLYVKNLNQNVWSTKGMLNIIPTKIITSNEILMN